MKKNRENDEKTPQLKHEKTQKNAKLGLKWGKYTEKSPKNALNVRRGLDETAKTMYY